MSAATNCVQWDGYVDRHGYGRRRWHGKMAFAHRVAYEVAKGPIQPGLVIDHLCRNRACVNPDHLEAVTFAENISRGREATKTHCVKGHPFDERNTYLRPSGGKRRCRACQREAVDRYQARLALAKAGVA